MLDGGILRAHRLNNDWASVLHAMSNSIDLTELDIMETLAHIIAHNRDSTATGVPSLSKFLKLVIVYPTTSAAVRIAIRRTLPDAADIVAVLEVLEGWLKFWAESGVKLMSDKNDAKDEKRTPMAAEGHVPDQAQVVSFTQSVLDATFVALIQYTPSHPLLQRIRDLIEPQIDMLVSLEKLRGYLLPFVRLQNQATREAQERKEFPDKKPPQLDWRQRWKELHKLADVAIGLYQLEEIVV